MVLHGCVESTFRANIFSLYDAVLALLRICVAARTPVAVQLLKLNVDVLCVASSHMPVADAIKSSVTPALCDQLISMSKTVKKNASQNPKVRSKTFLMFMQAPSCILILLGWLISQ